MDDLADLEVFGDDAWVGGLEVVDGGGVAGGDGAQCVAGTNGVGSHVGKYMEEILLKNRLVLTKLEMKFSSQRR